jgi:hypothetical protein
MGNYNKIAITRPGIGLAHPFKIDILKDGRRGDGLPNFKLAVNYHSRLFVGMSLNSKYLSYRKVGIKGLDFAQPVPASFPGKNYYCVLKIPVTDLQVPEGTSTSAEIIWVEDDKTVNELNPIIFESNDNLKQTEARIIIGVLVSDDEAIAGTDNTAVVNGQTVGGAGAVNTAYVVQFINTNLMMCNMVFDGVPVIYPVPFGGGRLNF